MESLEDMDVNSDIRLGSASLKLSISVPAFVSCSLRVFLFLSKEVLNNVVKSHKHLLPPQVTMF